MAKKNNNYFELIKNQASYCVKASALLEKILRDFDADKIEDYRDRMHEIEHTADSVHHDILNKLSTEFITPIDQEDILLLVQIIDDITDALDEVILDIYMYRMQEIPEKAAELARAVNRCVNAMYEATEELKNFKKPTELHTKIIKVNDTEGDADDIYTEAIRELFGATDDVKALIGGKAVYEGLENCCDLCEHATDVISQVIIKNT